MNYRQEHLCTATCVSPGICEIETAPHSIEATFTGRNETFQYTKVCSLVSNAYASTNTSLSILRVRWNSNVLSTVLTLTLCGSCEALEMC